MTSSSNPSPAAKPKRRSRALGALLSFGRSTLLKERNASTRIRRYVRLGGVLLGIIWMAVLAYSFLLAKTYTSEMTLILPGARSSSVFSLDSIGQANTQSDSPFSSITSTPKVIYQSIALSDDVLARVAKRSGVDLFEFPKPKIELIDETSLMIFRVYGKTSDQARERAQSLLDVFLAKLDELRKDEIDRREQSVRAGLSDVENNLKKARSDILEYSQSSNVVSPDQIKAMSDQVEQLRSHLDQVEADEHRAEGERDQLTAILGVSAVEAAKALRLQDDPRYAALLKERTDAMTLLSANLDKWGPNHPLALASKEHFESADTAIHRLAAGDLGDLSEFRLDDILTTSKDRSELYRKLVEFDAEANGLKKNRASLQETLTQEPASLAERNAKAARLADLERNHKIAEAVFSSALARIDSGRQDIFGSYPLVQVMSEPTLPDKPTSPQPQIAFAGGAVATVLVLVGIWLAWIRQPFLRKHLAAD